MATQFTSFRTALAWYADHLTVRRRFSSTDVRQQLGWLKEFAAAFPRRRGPTDVTIRDVVCYFAERCDEFPDTVEWYRRYKAIEAFYDEITRVFALPSNHIKGLYDESDLEPDLLRRIPIRDRLAPVNWSREDQYIY